MRTQIQELGAVLSKSTSPSLPEWQFLLYQGSVHAPSTRALDLTESQRAASGSSLHLSLCFLALLGPLFLIQDLFSAINTVARDLHSCSLPPDFT